MEQLNQRTPEQHKRLFGLLKALNLIHMRDALALEFSEGQTYKTSELTEAQCAELIHKLQLQIAMKQPDPKNATPMARKFFHICYKLGWETDGKLDYAHIDNWCTKYSYMRKPFRGYKEHELPALLTQIECLLNGNNDRPGGDETHIGVD